MTVTWIKTSVACGLVLAATIFHTTPAEAGPFGRAVLGHVINNSPRAQMIAGTVAPIVQTAQMQGGRLSPGQIVQAVSDGRNLVQNLRFAPLPRNTIQLPVQQFSGMTAQEMPLEQVSYSGPTPQDSVPQGPLPEELGPQGAQEMAPVDLLVENITLASPATKVAGPAYKITVRNQGSEVAAKFHLGLFASLDGKVNEQCPKAFLEVRDLAPNTSSDYTIRLPKAADKMLDPETKEPVSFKHIAVAVDFFGLQPEADESNNTAVLPREEVEGAEVSAK